MITVQEKDRLDNNVGVIIGRFQVHELHKGYLDLINSVSESHDCMIIFLGINDDKFTPSNPLPFVCRRDMISQSFPNAIVLPIQDCESNELWVKNLDSMIVSVTNKDDKVMLYGSRDSFVDTYRAFNGLFNCCELSPEVKQSGSEIRMEIKRNAINSSDFRRGIIYSVINGNNK